MALNAPPHLVDSSSSVQFEDGQNAFKRSQTIPGTISDDTDFEVETEIAPVPLDENEMSEEQLRELYDSEEIDRFLNLFSAYVTEVSLPERLDPLDAKDAESRDTASESKAQSNSGGSEDGDWIPIIDEAGGPILPVTLPQESDGYLSEYIANHYIIPRLPPAPLPTPPFTLGRLRVTTQRLYLAVQPAYVPFFSGLARLAIWEDRVQSLIYCAAFWTLWWNNLLLPALFLRIFYALICRKIFPYPTVQELRKRRAEVVRANAFGDQVQARLVPSSSFGLTELWRIFKVFNKPKVDKAKCVIKEGKGKKEADDKNGDSQPPIEAATVLDDSEGSGHDRDTKRALLQILAGIADLHERVKNIAIWRRPASSYLYTGIVFFLSVVTLLLPTKYIAKLACAISGIIFWHIVPIMSAMSAADRARLPPTFNDVPTDSDYALDLISQRVASGLHVKPTPSRKPKIAKAQNAEASSNEPIKSSKKEDKPIDWKKWGDRAAIGKAAIARTALGKAALGPGTEDEKRLATGTEWRRTGTWPPRNPLIPASILLHGAPTPWIETHTFPAHHTSGPGLITLTPRTFFFTPLISASATITVAFSDLRGVKKTGIFKGLSVRWAEADRDGTEKEEKFMWVGDRDELFARLIGPDGRRWLKV